MSEPGKKFVEEISTEDVEYGINIGNKKNPESTTKLVEAKSFKKIWQKRFSR